MFQEERQAGRSFPALRTANCGGGQARGSFLPSVTLDNSDLITLIEVNYNLRIILEYEVWNKG